MTFGEQLAHWLGKLTGWVASAGYLLLSVAFHRGYFEYLPPGAKAWLERKAGNQVEDGPGQANVKRHK